MSKMKQVFQEEQEARSIQDEFLDDEYIQRVREVNDQQRRVLNEIFESWGRIYAAKDVKSKSNEDNDF